MCIRDRPQCMRWRFCGTVERQRDRKIDTAYTVGLHGFVRISSLTVTPLCWLWFKYSSTVVLLLSTIRTPHSNSCTCFYCTFRLYKMTKEWTWLDCSIQHVEWTQLPEWKTNAAQAYLHNHSGQTSSTKIWLLNAHDPARIKMLAVKIFTTELSWCYTFFLFAEAWDITNTHSTL